MVCKNSILYILELMFFADNCYKLSDTEYKQVSSASIFVGAFILSDSVTRHTKPQMRKQLK